MSNYGVVGRFISYSRSPSIHQRWMTFYGLSETYELWDIPLVTAADFFKTFLTSGGRGLNITTPFKRDFFNILPCVDELGTLACAVNTVNITETGDIFGYNTDAKALIDLLGGASNNPFSKLCHFAPLQSAFILGGGGVMGGSLAALSKTSCQTVSIFSRSLAFVPPALQGRFDHIDFYPWSFDLPLVQRAIEDADVVIHATPCQGNDLVLLLERMKPFSTLVIWSYTDCLDFLKNQATLKSIRIIDGLTLLYQQARYSFYHWFGIFPFMPLFEDEGSAKSV